MLNKLKVAVTGGSGFLGSHLLPLLNNFQVACLSRPTSGKNRFPANVRVVSGDCLDEKSLVPFLEGQDVLIHMASVLFAPSWQSYLDSNAQGTRNILAAMAKLSKSSRPSKVIYISSLAAAGPCALTPGIDEKATPSPVSAYGWSKLFSEKLFQEALGDNVLILRPPIIYGSGDKGLLPMFKCAKRGFGVSPGAFRDFPVSIIHADDVADAILLFLNKWAGGIYHLNDGEEHDMASICKAMGKALGQKVKIVRPPLPLMGLSASFCSAWANIKTSNLFKSQAPKTPQWNLDKFREARQQGWLANARRIKDEHGFAPKINLEKGMKEAVQGYQRIGLL